VAPSKVKRSPTSPGQNRVWDLLLPRLREGLILVEIAICIYLACALLSFDSADPGFTFTGSSAQVSNIMGSTGAWFADVALAIFGFMAFVFPLILAVHILRTALSKNRTPGFDPALFVVQGIGLVLGVISGAALCHLHFYGVGLDLREGSGGLVGMQAGELLVPLLSYVGTTLTLVLFFLIGLTLLMDISWISVLDTTGRLSLQFYDVLRDRWNRFRNHRLEVSKALKTTKARRVALEKHVEQEQARIPLVIQSPETKEPEISARAAREKQGNLFTMETVEGLPALSLLDVNDSSNQRGYSAQDLEAMSRLLELKLRDYGVEATVVAVFPGPVITRFEIQPAPGVKVSRISGLAKDLARSLAVISVRVVEVIPGKPVVGIEIPNEDRQIVRLSQVLSSKAYDLSLSPLSLALGHDIAGEPVVVDLARMPHLLVAGTTGSGKSVGLNAMILSILFKSSPEDVRLIMVDPKMLELAVYEGIPHLLTPVVTDMKDAANALRWCVAEMERRYKLMASLGVRNIGGFNRKVTDAEKAGHPLKDPFWEIDPLSEEETQLASDLETLPFIVVVIDEFADLMMIVGKKVEELIARIAQKARAAGIHLILATQRPSVDVITGLIKANVPTRIGFQVSSKVDSRTILDQGGAEQLLGHGDMLYMPGGTPIPVRVHGAFVDDDEVHRVVESWKSLAEPNYLDSILDTRTDAELLPGSAGGKEDQQGEADPLYDEAVAFVTSSGRVSISSVQRKLRIGYNRAARMVEEMEQAGVVSPMNTNGSREVLAHAPPD
jgi:DNA segregation ATPase FtsK/SpoIIIE, S-DNA-T family